MTRQSSRRVLFAGFVLAALAVIAVIAVARLPLREPTVLTQDQYASLMLNRAVREDVRGEPAAPSVRDIAVTPTVAAPPPPSSVERLRIPRIGVDAPVLEMGVGPDGVMESPAGPEPVAWYGFSAKPGAPGNAVFSGHVDFHDYGPAVFWNLRKLQLGDVIEVALQNGTVLPYAVTATQQYSAATIPMADILATTPVATVTLITCAGTFGAGHYSDLLVVRALSTLSPQVGRR